MVRFEGEGSGVEPLTWGQIGLWQGVEANGKSPTMGGTMPIPPGLSVEDAAEMLRFITSRHQSLRTRLRLQGPGTPPLQVVETAGEVPLDIVDVGDGEDPAEVAAAVERGYQKKNFDYETEWPVRMAVIRQDGAITHAVVTYLHLSLDATGLEVLFADLAARDPQTGEAAAPVTAMQPLEQARSQRTPAAQRQNASSLRHLDTVLRAVSPLRFGEPRYPGEPTFEAVRYTSPATLLAIRSIAARDMVHTSPILLACFAVGLARVTANNPVLAMILVSNRFRPRFAESVSAVVQVSPFMIDVADISLREAVIRARSGVMATYKNAYYDPYEQDEVIDRIQADRGQEVDLDCFYNDRRNPDRDESADPIATPEEIRAALPLSTMSWPDEIGLPRRSLYLHVDDPDGAIEFNLSVDRRFFSRPDAESVARAFEAVAVESALDPSALTAIPTPLPTAP